MIHINNNNIKLTHTKKKNINGFKNIVFYFSELLQDNVINHEISIGLYNDSIYSSSKNNHFEPLDEFGEYFNYNNKILFDKNKLIEELNNIKQEKKINKVDYFSEVFGINVKNNSLLHSLEFDSIVRLTDVEIGLNNATSNGYMFVFKDPAFGSIKFSFYIGGVTQLTYNKYVENVSKYGITNILNNIEVSEQNGDCLITNKTPFLVELTLSKKEYKSFLNKEFEREYELTEEFTKNISIDPFSNISIVNSDTTNISYNMMNPFVFEKTKISLKNNDDYKYLWLTKGTPYEIKINNIGVKSYSGGSEDLDKMVVLFDVEQGVDLSGRKKTITTINDTNNIEIGSISIKSDYLKYFTSKNELYKLFFGNMSSTLFLKVNNKTYPFNYILNSSDIVVNSISKNTRLNDVISEEMEMIEIEILVSDSINNFLSENSFVDLRKFTEDTKTIDDSKIYENISNVYKNGILIPIDDVSKLPHKKYTKMSIFKTGDIGFDLSVNDFIDKTSNNTTNYSFIDGKFSLSASNILRSSYSTDITTAYNPNAQENVSYKLHKHLSDLGYQVQMEEILKILKKADYIFSEPKTSIARIVIGISKDKKWMSLGDSFFKVDEVFEPKITTFMDNATIEYLLDKKHGFIFDKKDFSSFTNDKHEFVSEFIQSIKNMASGKSIDMELIKNNSVVRYMVKHFLPTSASEFYSDENIVSFFSDKDIYRDIDNLNKIVFPNIMNMFGLSKDKPQTKLIFGKYSMETYQDNSEYISFLDSIEKINLKHNVYLTVNKLSMFLLADMFDEVSYNILGLTIKNYKNTERPVLKYLYGNNYIFNGEMFSHYIKIEIDKEYFLYLYDYKTKRLEVAVSNNVEINNIHFLTNLFMSLIIKNTDSIDGYVRTEQIGVYLPEGENDDIAPKYLFMPNKYTIDRKYIPYIIEIQNGNIYFFVDIATGKIFKNYFKVAKGNVDDANVSIENNKLTITSNLSNQTIDVNVLANNKEDTLNVNDFIIRIHKSKKEIPNGYMLNSVFVSVDDILVNLKINKFNVVKKDNNITYVMFLSGDGVIIYYYNEKYFMGSKNIAKLDNILSKKVSNKTMDVFGLKIKIIDINGEEL